MAMKEVNTLIIDMKKWPDVPLVGFYLGTTSYEDPTYHKTQYVHAFQKESGEQISIYGYTTLDSRMTKVPVGVLCQVTYKGTESMQTKNYGVKDVHQCEVLMDIDRRIETDTLPLAHAPAAKAPNAPPAAAPGKGKAVPAKTPVDDPPPF